MLQFGLKDSWGGGLLESLWEPLQFKTLLLWGKEKSLSNGSHLLLVRALPPGANGLHFWGETGGRGGASGTWGRACVKPVAEPASQGGSARNSSDAQQGYLTREVRRTGGRMRRLSWAPGNARSREWGREIEKINVWQRGNIIQHPLYVELGRYKWTYRTEEIHRLRKWIYSCQGEGIAWVFGMNMHTLLRFNGSPTRTYCTAHRELCSTLYGRLDEKGVCGENRYMCRYGWVPLLFTWNYRNINWLYPKIKS